MLMRMYSPGIKESSNLKQYRDQKDAALFLIHVSPTMVQPYANEDKSALKMALERAYQFLLQRIISQPNDMIGILLFGTVIPHFTPLTLQEKTKVEGNYSHLYNLMDLEVPEASSIKELKHLLNGYPSISVLTTDDKALYELCTPSKDGALMANVLFAANTILTSKAARFGSRRIFLVTDDDSPGSKEAQKSAITRARDLNDLGIRLEPYFVSHPGQPKFDNSKFYENIIYRDDEDQDEGEYHLPTDAAARFETLLSMITAKQTPRRSQFNLLMELDPGMQIGVKGFILVKRQEVQRSHYVFTGGDELATAKVESADIDPVVLSPGSDSRDQVKSFLKRLSKGHTDLVATMSSLHLTS
jgi:ATP-dependent DNA helicase 2 subunit 1